MRLPINLTLLDQPRKKRRGLIRTHLLQRLKEDGTKVAEGTSGATTIYGGGRSGKQELIERREKG